MFAPYCSTNIIVPSEWIDINDHMNSTHYGLVIYDAHASLQQAIGIDQHYIERQRCGKAVLESHMVYEREVSEGDELEVHSWLLAIDSKRFHFFHELINKSKNCRAATAEQVDIHMDLSTRRSAPMPDFLYSNMQKIVIATLDRTMPAGVGSVLRPPVNRWLG